MSDLPPFASWQDVQGIWRQLTASEIDVVENRICQASNQVRDETPRVGGLTVDERIDAGTLRLETVKDVVVGMVERIVVPPRFARQHSVSVDDGMESITIDSIISSGEMFISDTQMARLTGRKSRGQRAFTISPGPGPTWT